MTRSANEFGKLFDDSIEELLPPQRGAVDIPLICPMDLYETKRAAARDVLSSLACMKCSLDEVTARDLSVFFVKLYFDMHEGFRHMYSDVYAVLKGLLKSNGRLDEDVPFEAINLSNNIDLIEKELVKSGVNENAILHIRKLHDHIELENNRIEYMAIQNREQQKKIRKLKQKFEDSIKEKVAGAEASFSRKVETDIEDAQQKLQRNYITILGIFAAIVVAFMSGTAFSSSVLENIDKASIYRISFVVLLVGFFMFNMTCALFMFLNKVSDIDNKAMRKLLRLVNALFIAFIVVVVVARAVDLVAIFPVLVQRLFGL
ncbi:hypothetical protein [Paraeggerthella hongkongensis]|nr:hypothetical protein [Paraeggerthella hongkongensis]